MVSANPGTQGVSQGLLQLLEIPKDLDPRVYDTDFGKPLVV